MKWNTDAPRWLGGLSEEDLTFVKRFLLASGSLKELAKEYGISYPTVRLRLDRLIEKVRIHDEQGVQSEFERELRSLYVDGRLDRESMRKLLDSHRKETGETGETETESNES